MNPSAAAHYLGAIKSTILSVAGIENLSPVHCRLLSFLIMENTGLGVSEITLSRFFGFVASKFQPSAFTLNALAIYCGYDNWDTYCLSVNSQKFTAGDVSIVTLLNHPLFSTILNTPVPTVILNTDAPEFTIVGYNKAYEQGTGIQKRNIRGLSLWKAFNASKAGGSGPTLLLEGFHQVISSQQAVHLPALQYNIPFAAPNLGLSTWWDVNITPIIYDGLSKYLLLHVYNITDKVHRDDIEKAIMKELTMAENLAITNVRLQKALEGLAESHVELTKAKGQLQDLNAHLEERVLDRTHKLLESEGRQRALIDHAPVAIAILKGPDHIIETANKKIIAYWGKTEKVLGQPLRKALPEIEGQPFIPILDKVRRTGTPYANAELQAYLNIDGSIRSRYFDMLYHPVQHVAGTTDYIYIIATDITEHVLARKKLEESESMLRLAVTASNIGIWSFDLNKRQLTYNSIFADILGWNNLQPMTYEQAIGQVTEEYREKLRIVAETAMASGESYDFTYSQRRFNDEEIIWLRGTGKVTTNDFGGYCFSGIIMQVPYDLEDNKQQQSDSSFKITDL